MKRNILFAGVSMLGLGLVLQACAPTETTKPETMKPAPGTIVDVAKGNKDFSTLVTAVVAADLATTLSGPGPFTVFAPTNAAFAKLPAGTVETLVKPENKEALAKILTYHVVSGKTEAATVLTLNGKTVKTVQGGDITVKIDGTNVSLIDAKGGVSKVTMTDIQASNGVIHVIDTVLMPK